MEKIAFRECLCCFSACFVIFYATVFNGPFCLGAYKIELSTLFTSFFFEHF